jgi:hypothetical protein
VTLSCSNGDRPTVAFERWAAKNTEMEDRLRFQGCLPGRHRVFTAHSYSSSRNRHASGGSIWFFSE